MTIIERLNQFFLNCPLLQEGKIKSNYLPADEREYSIDGIPATQIIKQYLDGSSIRQYQFVFRTQAYHSLELSEGLANSGFFEDLAAWLEVQTKTGTLPDMEAGKECSCTVRKQATENKR